MARSSSDQCELGLESETESQSQSQCDCDPAELDRLHPLGDRAPAASASGRPGEISGAHFTLAHNSYRRRAAARLASNCTGLPFIHGLSEDAARWRDRIL